MKNDNKDLIVLFPLATIQDYKYYFDPCTTHNSTRLWVTEAAAPRRVRALFDVISAWGGPDREENGMVSWELAPNITEANVRSWLTRLLSEGMPAGKDDIF